MPKIWKVVKNVKLRIFRYECELLVCNCEGGVYGEAIRESQIKALEQELGIKSSELRFRNMTAEDLEIAAKMFIYLMTCPDTKYWREWFKSWELFYNDLFFQSPDHIVQSPDQIILTLNRMMKMKNVLEDDGKIRAEKLFVGAEHQLDLKYGEMQRLLGRINVTSSKNTHTGTLKSEGI